MAARLEALAGALAKLTPCAGTVPDNRWKTGKLYSPHVVQVLAELFELEAAPTKAVALLLLQNGDFAARVANDYE